MEQEVKVCKKCQQEKPVTEFFRNKNGYTDVCKDCAKEKGNETRKKHSKVADLEAKLEEAKKMRLSQFTPRELMEELYRRGYDGDLLAPRQVVNIAKIGREKEAKL